MSARRRVLGAAEIRALLDEIGRRLESAGRSADMLVVGGAAMALSFDSHRATVDLDAVTTSDQIVRALADEVGAEHGLAPGWFSSAAAPWLPPVARQWAGKASRTGGLRVQVADARSLLAMKMIANRERDVPDLVVLFRELRIDDPAQVVSIVHEAYPDGIGARMPSDDDMRVGAAEIIERL